MVPWMPSIMPVRGRRSPPLACVVGDLGLVRALGCRGIPLAVATSDPRSSATKSRYCQTVVPRAGL